MSLSTRRELTITVTARYKIASKTQKSQMLDEFIENTGYNRKYAIWLLDRTRRFGSLKKEIAPLPRTRRRKYGADVEQAFLILWRISGGVCPKRLTPFLKELIEALERFDEIHLCPPVKEKLLDMSVSTAQRLLQRGLRSRNAGSARPFPARCFASRSPSEPTRIGARIGPVSWKSIWWRIAGGRRRAITCIR